MSDVPSLVDDVPVIYGPIDPERLQRAERVETPKDWIIVPAFLADEFAALYARRLGVLDGPAPA